MPAWSAAAGQDESHHAEPPENRSTMTACQKLVQSPSATRRASSDPITPSSPPQETLYEIFDPSSTLHLSFKIKCCVDRLRPPELNGLGADIAPRLFDLITDASEYWIARFFAGDDGWGYGVFALVELTKASLLRFNHLQHHGRRHRQTVKTFAERVVDGDGDRGPDRHQRPSADALDALRMLRVRHLDHHRIQHR